MEAGEPTSVFVTHVDDPVEVGNAPGYCSVVFWGQKNRVGAVRLQQHLAANADSFFQANSPVAAGTICCVSVDGVWRRAILDKDLGDGQVELALIDHGSKVKMSSSELRIIPREGGFLKTSPPFASRYVLADIMIPANQYAKDLTISLLKKVAESQTLRLISMGFYAGTEGVRAYTVKDQLLAKILVDADSADGSIGIVAAKTYQEAIKTLLSPGKRSNTTSPVVAVVRPPSITPDITSRDVYLAPMLESNVVQLVTVTNVLNGPQKFTVQRVNAATEHALTIIRRKLESTDPKPLDNPGRGTTCMAFSSKDLRLHRGLVAAKASENHFSVYFVDYGYMELVNIKSMFQIPSDIVTLELQAVRVSLAGIEDVLSCEGLAEQFTKMVLGKNFNCRVVVADTSPQSVRLSDSSCRDVKDMLIEAIQPRRSAPVDCRTDYKLDEAQIDSEEELFVTTVGPPGYFFGQFIKRKLEDLDAVQLELQAVYGSNERPPLLYSDAKGHVGDLAVIKWSEDDKPYRVKIVEEFATDVEVSFVDYGNRIRLARSEVRAPVAGLKLFTLPPFGMYCYVGSVQLGLEEWSTRLADKVVRVRLGGSPNEEGVYPATFSDCEVNKDVILSLRKVFPASRGPSPATASSFYPLSRQATIERVLDFDDTATEEMNWGRGTSDTSTPLSPCRNDNGWGHTFAAGATIISPPHVPADGDAGHVPYTQRALPIAEPVDFFYGHPPELTGQTKAVEVTYVDDPQSFYCRLIENIPAVDALIAKLSTTYQGSAKPSAFSGQKIAKVGVACVAQYSKDGAWYRGQIDLIHGDDATVLFVDYGHRQRCSLSTLKAMEEDLMSLAPQAIHCGLKDVRKDREWTVEEKMHFKQTVMNKTFIGTFNNRDSLGKYSLRLVEEGSDEYVVVNELFGAPSRTNVPVPDGPYSYLPVTRSARDVCVSWFCGLNRFFLSPPDTSEFHSELDELEKFYSSLLPDQLIETEPAVGLPCVVGFSEDKRNYRSKVLSIKDDKVQILFVDYGNEEDTNLRSIKRIVPRFMQFPVLAWECCLKGLPSDVKVDKQHIDACFSTEGILTAVLHSPDPVTGVYPVDLTLPEIGDVASYLLRHNKAIPSDVVLNPHRMDFAPDDILSCRAYITFVTSLTHFCVQLEPQTVDELMDSIDIIASKPEFNSFSGLNVSVGKFYLARFSEDMRWYRALVESIEGDVATVVYVDYGNTDKVKTGDLRPLPATLAQQPILAVKCSLDGAEGATKEMDEAFQLLVLDFAGTVKFVKAVDGVVHVRLFEGPVDLKDKISLKDQEVKEAEVYVSYTESPSRFWVQLKEDESKLAQVEESLAKLNEAGPDSYVQPVAGQVVYAVNHPVYSTWYRAVVKSLNNDETALVHFIDYGDSRTVKVSDIRKLPVDMMGLPALAVQCRVKQETKWLDEAVTYFNEACTADSAAFRAVFGDPVDGIRVIESLSINDENILDALMAKNEPRSPTSGSEEFRASGRESPEGQSIEKRDEDLSSEESAHINRLLSSKALIVTVTSPLDVWMQLDPSASVSLRERIDYFIANPEFPEVPVALVIPRVGQLCLAQFEDGLWYRAVILSVDSDYAWVRYVDYGNTSHVLTTDLRPLPTQLDHPEALAVKFALDGADRCPAPAIEDLQKVLLGKQFIVNVTKKTDKHVFIRLLDLEDKSDVNSKLGLMPDKDLKEPSAAQLGEEVYVSYVESPSQFWIQKKEDEEVLVQLGQSLDKASHKTVHVDGKVGEICIVQHPEYLTWYRARLDTVDGDRVKAHFIDYGDTLWVAGTDKVRQCPPMLRHLPPMATRCALKMPSMVDPGRADVIKIFTDCTDGVLCRAVLGPVTGGIQQVTSLYVDDKDVIALMAGAGLSPVSEEASTSSSLPSIFSRQRGL